MKRYIRTSITLAAMAVLLAACSAGEPGGEGLVPVLPNAKLETLSKQSVRGKSCKRIEKWYEGFFAKKQIHEGAEGELDKAISVEEARLRRRGYTSFAVSKRSTTCKPTYPIGFKEWKCFASANLCAGNRKTAAKKKS